MVMDTGMAMAMVITQTKNSDLFESFQSNFVIVRQRRFVSKAASRVASLSTAKIQVP